MKLNAQSVQALVQIEEEARWNSDTTLRNMSNALDWYIISSITFNSEETVKEAMSSADMLTQAKAMLVLDNYFDSLNL